MTTLSPLDRLRPPEVAMDRNHHETAEARAMPRNNETTFWILPTLSARHQMVRIVAGNKSIRLPSSATSVRSVSQEHTIFVLTFAHIQTNDLSFAQSAVKPLHASTIASATRVFIPARRSSYAKVPYKVVQAGVAGADLLVRMLWAATSGQKPDEFASNLCSTRKPPRGRRRGSKSSSRHKLQQVWWRHCPWRSHIRTRCTTSKSLRHCCSNTQLLLASIGTH